MKLRVTACYKTISSTEKKKTPLFLEKRKVSSSLSFDEILQKEIRKQTK